MRPIVRRATRIAARAVAGLVLLAAPLAGQAGVEGSNASIARTVISLPGHAAPILLDTIGVTSELAGPPTQAFAALVLAYQQLKVPVSMRDEGRRYIGNMHFTTMHRLGSIPLSQIVDCGVGMTGPRADSYRVHLVVVSRIDTVAGGRSRLKSTVVAGAEDVEGPSKEPIACGSSGVLESRIADIVATHLKAAP